MTDRPAHPAGPTLVRADWIATAVFTVAMALTAALPDAFVVVGVGVSLALFGAGIVIFGIAYARAVQRSRSDELHLAGLFFLAGSAPREVQRSLLGAMVVQLAVGIGAASLRPFTPLAFGTLVPVLGLAVAALWSATHGTYPPRRLDRPVRVVAGPASSPKPRNAERKAPRPGPPRPRTGPAPERG